MTISFIFQELRDLTAILTPMSVALAHAKTMVIVWTWSTITSKDDAITFLSLSKITFRMEGKCYFFSIFPFFVVLLFFFTFGLCP